MKKKIATFAILALTSQLIFAQKKSTVSKDIPIYKNVSKSVHERTTDLLSKMTLEEKIGQMTQIAVSQINDDKAISKSDKFRPFLMKERAEKLLDKYPIGSFLCGFAVTPQQWYQYIYDLQKIVISKSRLGIPMIYGNDHIHGSNYTIGGTVFPQALGLAATFNIEMAKKMGSITSLEIADIGQQWNFAPVLDIGRNPYWPRLYESMGEDPYLVGTMGAAFIESLQNEKGTAPYKVAGCAKHFIGYSDPKSGWDRAPSSIPDQELREIFLPPFKKAIDAGVKTFMINSGELNGVPVHASKKLLTDILRTELGFKGVVVTDWADILQLVGQHKVAATEKEATLMAIEAGIDMSMTATTTTFCDVVKELVTEGSLPIETIDRSVYRILSLKFELGMFENPYPRNDRFARIGSKAHKAEALKAAEESIVLLENKNKILPIINQPKKILLVGPTIDSKRNLCGAWTIEWGGAYENELPKEMETVYGAMKRKFPNSTIDTAFYSGEKGSKTRFSFNEKLSAADLVLMVMGEKPHAEGNGNTDNLALPEDQDEIIQLVQNTGKKNIILMVSGRPRLLHQYISKADAIIWAGLPAYEGAPAIVNILTGTVNPSGKLPFNYPSGPAHILPYNAKVHDKPTPDWSFGYGLSYTQFKYSNFKLSDTIINRNKNITASITVTNTGSAKGKEAVLWYITDEYRTITPLIKKLSSFEKIELNPGESKTISFTINPMEQLSFPNEQGKILLEDGDFIVEVGGLKKSFLLNNNPILKTKNGLKNRSYLQTEVGTD